MSRRLQACSHASRETIPFVLCALLLMTWSNRSHAQVNVESLSETIDKPGLGLSAKSNLSYASGNVNLLGLRGQAAAYYATKHPDAPPEADVFWFRDRILLHGSAGITKAEGRQVANDGFGHVRFTHMQWLRVGGEVFGQAQYDYFRLLQRRLLGGTGARVVLSNIPSFRSWFGTGYMFEFERRNIPAENRPPAGPDPTNMTNHRWNNYVTLSVTIVPDVLELLSTTYVQPRWDDFRDVQVLEEGSLQVKVVEHVSLSTDVTLRYDSRAPVSVSRRDLRVGQGLVLSY